MPNRDEIPVRPDKITNGGDNSNTLDKEGEQSYNWSKLSKEDKPMNTAVAAPATLPITEMLSQSLVPKVAVSYLRVSTRDQAYRGGESEGFSIPAQREANRHKAASLGAIITKEFADRGASAKTTNRPELQKMLDYVSENEVDYVIVHKVDRLARSRADDVEINKALDLADVKLVSTTESIDETPSGVLLHGIMSSIAEFYSRNLANEVVKGMNQKVRGGGTVSKAPLGYLNVRTVNSEGREVRTVTLDPERASLITLAFELYSTGDWTLANLAEHLNSLGLTTQKTPSVPSKPIDKNKLNKILLNPYYKGLVKFQGTYHPGKHEPLIDERTWQLVQDIMTAHMNGERTRAHPHFLKGTVFCGSCGSRLGVHMAKSRSGDCYPYFICMGRHSKRVDCTQKAVLIEEVEARIEEHYERIALDPEFRQAVETMLVEELRSARNNAETQLQSLRREREKLERQRDKLMQAHYEGAIPVELLKLEQDRIATGLLGINKRLEASNLHFDEIESNLKMALDLTVDCAFAYQTATDKIKKQFNQVFFNRIFVNADTSLDTELAPPFDTLLGPGAQTTIKRLEAGSPESAKKPTLSSELLFLSNNSNPSAFRQIASFFTNGLSKRLLVGVRGFEPMTSAV